MGINNNLPVNEFPMKIYWNEEPTTEFLTEQEAFQVDLIDYPKDDFRKRCVLASLSTWNYKQENIQLTQNDIDKVFKEILTYKMLPNTMESLIFSFRFHNLTHIEISHILRHRMFFSICAVCSGDRDLRHDNVMIPESIQNSKFKEKYEKLSEECKQLYSEMLDSKDISLMDARYILNRNHCYDYYISMNLKDAIAFINQRKCQQVQPFSDNILAKRIYDHICSIIPEIKDIISLKCDKSCHFTKNLERNTRLYLPDKTHEQLFEYNENNFVYHKTREEMGVPKWVQD